MKQTGLTKIKFFALAFILAFAAMLPFLIKDGGWLVYFGDYNIQQVPFYIKIHEAVRNGNFFWDMNTDLGSSIYTSYSFYLLGSPFFWLTVPFPKEFLPCLIPVLLMLKTAIAALGAYCYTGKYVKNMRSACIAGMLYAFCGFQTVSLVFNHFHDVTALFPFYMIALEKLAEEHKRGRFAFMTACMAIINYFFFAGQTVFLVIYVLVRYMTGENGWSRRERIKCLLRIGAEWLMGLLMSCFFFVPSIVSVLSNSRVSSTIFQRNPFVYEDAKTYGALLKSLFLPPDAVNTSTLFGTEEGAVASLSLFLPLFAISGVIAFFIQKKGKDFRKRLCVITLILALLPLGNSLFVAGNAEYYTRWFFMPLLVMSMMTAVAVEEFDQKAFSIGTCVFIGMYVIFLIIAEVSKHVSGSMGDFLNIMNRSCYNSELIFSGICLLVLIYIVWVLGKDSKGRYLNKVLICTVVLCGVNLYMHMSMGYQKVDESGREAYKAQVKAQIDLPEDESGEFYRIEMDSDSTNYSLFWDKPSVNCFLSTVSGSIIDFYDFAGIERQVKSSIPYDRAGIRSLLSVRYFLQNEMKSTDYGFVWQELLQGYEEYGKEEGFIIFQNKNALNMGTIFSYYMKPSEYERLSDKEKDLALLYVLVADEDTYRNAQMPLKEMTAEQFLDEMPKTEEALSVHCSALNETAADTFSYTDKELKLSYAGAEEGMVFLSVPYSDGFSAYVDGQRAEVIKVDGGLMAVAVSQGSKSVELVYREPGLIAGVILSGIGLLLFLVYMFVQKRRNV